MSTNPADVLAYSKAAQEGEEVPTRAMDDLPALAAFAQDVLALHVHEDRGVDFGLTPVAHWADFRHCTACQWTGHGHCPTVQLATKHGVAVTA